MRKDVGMSVIGHGQGRSREAGISHFKHDSLSLLWTNKFNVKKKVIILIIYD